MGVVNRNSTMITLHQTLTLSELLSGSYYLAARIKIIKVLFFFALIIGPLTALLGLVNVTQQPVIWYVILFDVIKFPLFIFLFFFVFISLGMTLMFLIRPDNYRNLTYRFTHWGMEKSGKNIEFTRPWSKFFALRESKHFLYLYISENDAHFIHKKVFENEQEIEEFKAFVGRQLGAA